MKARPLPDLRPVIVDRQEPEPSFLRRIATERREIVTQRLRCPVGLAVGDPGSQRRMRRLKRSGRDSGRDRVQVDVRRGGKQALLIGNTDAFIAAFPEGPDPIHLSSQLAQLMPDRVIVSLGAVQKLAVWRAQHQEQLNQGGDSCFSTTQPPSPPHKLLAKRIELTRLWPVLPGNARQNTLQCAAQIIALRLERREVHDERQ